VRCSGEIRGVGGRGATTTTRAIRTTGKMKKGKTKEGARGKKKTGEVAWLLLERPPGGEPRGDKRESKRTRSGEVV